MTNFDAQDIDINMKNYKSTQDLVDDLSRLDNSIEFLTLLLSKLTRHCFENHYGYTRLCNFGNIGEKPVKLFNLFKSNFSTCVYDNVYWEPRTYQIFAFKHDLLVDVFSPSFIKSLSKIYSEIKDGSFYEVYLEEQKV